VGIGYSLLRDGLPNPSVKQAQGTASISGAKPALTTNLPSPTAPPVPQITQNPFDAAIPQATREELARNLIKGQHHFADRSLSDMPSVTNYVFSADGTYMTSHCTAFGEVSERKFETTTGRWSVKEGRYANTGMIYFGIWLDDIPRASLLLDRDEGLQFNFSNNRVKMIPGNTTRCE